MLVLAPSLALAAGHPRYGGELRLLWPQGLALDEDRLDPAQARSPLELLLARTTSATLLGLAPDGALQGRLALVPTLERGGRVGALKLKPGLRFGSAAPLRAREVVESLKRLAAPDSPYRALLLPVGGGAGLFVRGDAEVALTFDFPYPDWPLGLTHPGAGVVGLARTKLLTGPAGETGPFVAEGRLQGPAARLGQNAESPDGRPFADKLSLRVMSRPNAARALAAGNAELSLVPVPDPKPVEGALTVATFLVVSPKRPALALVPARLSATLDRAELVRSYVRAPAQPLAALLVPALDPRPAAPAAAPSAEPIAPTTGELLVESGQDEQRAVAERLQVKLHDLGVELKVTQVARAELYGRIARGDFDAALACLPELPEPGLALAQVLLLAGSDAAARSELEALGKLETAPARRDQALAHARALGPTLPLVPLYAQGLGVTPRAGLMGLRFDPSGVFDAGELWWGGP
jgi:peptide/nickel transport system substrate-binding protein